MNGLSYMLSFIEGVLTFVSPCILPMLPIYFFYLAGASEDEDVASAADAKRSRMVTNSVAFVIGFTIVFVVLGAAATSLGQFLKAHIDVLRKLSGIVMIVFGLNFMGVLKLKFLNVEKRLEYKFKELKFINSIVFGAVFSFGWTPCLGAFLGSALLMAGNSDTLLQGMLLLLVYSIGLGIPFVLSAVAFVKLGKAFRKLQEYRRIISIVSGIVLILAGVLVFTDSLKYFGTLTW